MHAAFSLCWALGGRWLLETVGRDALQVSLDSRLLVLYGGINTGVSNAVLAGWIVPAGGYDSPAMAGHAWLWDPLFLLWGLALGGYLALSRGRDVKTGTLKSGS